MFLINLVAVLFLINTASVMQCALTTDCGPGTYYENGNCVSGSIGSSSSNLYYNGNNVITSNNGYAYPYYGNSYVAPYSNYYNNYNYNNGNTGGITCSNGACYPGSTTLNPQTGNFCYNGICYSSSSNTNSNGIVCNNGVCYYNGNSGSSTGYSCINGVCSYVYSG